MIDCLIIGDSIAQGVHEHRPECRVIAQRGINSREWNRKFGKQALNSPVVVISLGSNDHTNIRTIWELQQIRQRVDADRVYWIMPVSTDLQSMVRTVADSYGDVTLPILSVSKDHVHPDQRGYRELAKTLTED